MPDPNNIILPEHGIGFIGICKNGNTSVKAAFLESMGVRNHHRIHDNKHFRYVSADQVEASGLWYFAIKRDPISRAISGWRNKCFRSWKPHFERTAGLSRHMAFSDFVEAISRIPDEEIDQHFRSQTYEFARDRGQTIWPNLIIPFEELDEWWHLVQAESRIELPDIEHLNSMAKNDGPAVPPMTTADIDRLVLRYAKDYEELGYAVP